MPLPEPGCARGWFVGLLGRRPNEKAVAPHLRQPDAQRGTDACGRVGEGFDSKAAALRGDVASLVAESHKPAMPLGDSDREAGCLIASLPQ